MSLEPTHRVLCAGTCQATPLLDRFAAASAAGFTAVSIFTSDLESARAAGADLAMVKAAAAAAGLAITDIEIIARWLPEQEGAPSSFPSQLMQGLERARPEPVCRAAAELGARTVSVADVYETPFDAAHRAECFAAICEIAAAHGLRAALEFLPVGGVRGLAQAVEIIERADRANGGLVIDLWHLARSGGTAAALAAVPGDRLFSVQVGDAPAAPEPDLTAAMMSARRLPGEGQLDIGAMMRALAATGTTAPIGVEVFSDSLASLPMDALARRCAKALDYCLGLASDG